MCRDYNVSRKNQQRKKQKENTLCNIGLPTHDHTHTNSQSALHHVPEFYCQV